MDKDSQDLIRSSGVRIGNSRFGDIPPSPKFVSNSLGFSPFTLDNGHGAGLTIKDITRSDLILKPS